LFRDGVSRGFHMHLGQTGKNGCPKPPTQHQFAESGRQSQLIARWHYRMKNNYLVVSSISVQGITDEMSILCERSLF